MVISIIILSISVFILLLMVLVSGYVYIQQVEENTELKEQIKGYKEELKDYNRTIIDLRKAMEEAGMAYSKIYNEDN